MPRRDDIPQEVLHRFEHGGKRFAVDVDTCFCFECDAISWDVLEFYPHTTPNRIIQILREKHNPVEVGEVISELEWLRATKSIVPFTKTQDVPNLFTIERGLKHVAVIVPSEEGPAQRAQRRWFSRYDSDEQSTKAMELGRAALALLLGRAGEQKDLRLDHILGASADPAPLVKALGEEAFRQAQLAGKKLTIGIMLPNAMTMGDHAVAVRIDFTAPTHLADHTHALLKAEGALAKLVKVAGADDEHTRACAILRPKSPVFVEAVKALHDAGFKDIELDLDGSYAANPQLDSAAMQQGLSDTANYYAQRLLKNDYFRLEPIASLFAHIYHGIATRRGDPAGIHAMAIDAEGNIWPSLAFMNLRSVPSAGSTPTGLLGNVLTGDLDETALARFADVGVMATPECMRCWARHLCGGGSATIHQALSGSFRTPHEAWCAAQRDWMTAAVSAFNMLSSQGVHFTRIYQSMSRKGRPSFFQLARTAIKMTVIARPLAEADASMLREWENWNKASYFLLKPNGTLLTTKYDREMDALYPHGNAQEMLVTSRRGDALGLIKMQPDKWPGVYKAWLYLHREADYAAPAIRSGLKELIKQAATAQEIRRIAFRAADYETALRDCYTACGFKHEGTVREALYLTNHYHNIHIHTATIADL